MIIIMIINYDNYNNNKGKANIMSCQVAKLAYK